MSPYSNLISRCFEELLIISKQRKYVISRTYISWRVPACERATQCQRQRMSCSNPYTLACIWLSFLLFPLPIRRISFLLKAPRQLPVPENQAFKFPRVQPEQGACCGNQPCRVQPASNVSLVVSSIHLVVHVYPTLPSFSSPFELSDRFLPYILSPWRVLLKERHRCFTHCKCCLDVLHFIVWSSALVYEALQDLVIKVIRVP